MDQNTVITAMEAHAKRTGLKLSTIGQLAVSNRHAYDRLKAGTAQLATAEKILKWIEQNSSPSSDAPSAGAA